MASTSHQKRNQPLSDATFKPVSGRKLMGMSIGISLQYEAQIFTYHLQAVSAIKIRTALSDLLEKSREHWIALDVASAICPIWEGACFICRLPGIAPWLAGFYTGLGSYGWYLCGDKFMQDFNFL